MSKEVTYVGKEPCKESMPTVRHFLNKDVCKLGGALLVSFPYHAAMALACMQFNRVCLRQSCVHVYHLQRCLAQGFLCRVKLCAVHQLDLAELRLLPLGFVLFLILWLLASSSQLEIPSALVPSQAGS